MASESSPKKKRRSGKRSRRGGTRSRGQGRPPRVKRSQIDTERPADEPLSPEEVAEMKRHLAFIRQYRDALRPRLNAKEDLLVRGVRDPEHRGTCIRLLSKVDSSTLRAALRRKPLSADPEIRLRFLAQAAGISGDLDILLRFLETLAASAPSEDTARAFTRAVERIDLEALSAARLGRLLDVMQQAFQGHDRVGALFGLLQNPGFRAAFDTHADSLDPEVAGRFVPLRAVYDAISGGGRGRRGRSPVTPELADGLRHMLDAPGSMLGSYPARVRRSLLDMALRAEDERIDKHDGVKHLLRSLPDDHPATRRLGLAWAHRALARGDYERARSLLGPLAQGGNSGEPAALLEHLRAPRLGPLALGEASGPGLRRAFHLRRRCDVFVRTAEAAGAEGLGVEASLQANACLPGVASVVDRALGEAPWVAVIARGRRLDRVLADRRTRSTWGDVLELARAGIRIFHALALAGITLPDAEPSRFLVGAGPDREGPDWAGILLADFTGARAAEPDAAREQAATCATAFAHRALLFPPFRGRRLRREVPRDQRAPLERLLDRTPPPPELHAFLVRLG